MSGAAEPEVPSWPQTRAAQPVRVEGRAQPFDQGVKPRLRQDSVQPLKERMAAARRKVFRVHPHRRRLPRRRFLAHRHAGSVYGTRSPPSTPTLSEPRLLPQAVRSANSKRPVGTLPLTIGSNLLRSVVEKIINLLQQVRFLAIRALQQGVGFT